jgi:hypothetical protein
MMKLLRWGVQECYPAYTGPGDPIDAECIVIASFFTRRGAVRHIRREWPLGVTTRSQITHGLVQWDEILGTWRAAQ